METLWLLQYNNYYNRLVKSEPDLSGYQGYQVKYKGQLTDENGNTAVIENVNFFENDFVDTVQVVNWSGDVPDYLLVIEDTVIKSRWFVIEAQQTRGGQLQLTLHRDLVVDYMDQLLDDNTSMFVEKAIISSSNDLIFNKEDMSFNQIKTQETPLKDASECPWVCIYAASKTAEGTATTFTVNSGTSVPISRVFESEAEFNNWSVKRCVDEGKFLVGGLPNLQLITARGYKAIFPDDFWRAYNVNYLGEFTIETDEQEASQTGFLREVWAGSYVAEKFLGKWDAIRATLVNYYDQSSVAGKIIYDNEAYNAFNSEINQFVQVNTTAGPRYYKISQKSLNTLGLITFSPQISSSSGAIYSTIFDIINELFNLSLSSGRYIDFLYAIPNVKTPAIEDVTSSVSLGGVEVTANRFNLTDAPYDIMCMPFSDSLQIKNSLAASFTNVAANKQLALNIARELITKYSGAGTVYDAQILPYCPLTSTIVSKTDNTVTLDLMDATGKMYSPIKDNDGNTIGYILHASVSSFSREISLENPIVISDYKIESECDLYRLCSPNYNGVFEFNAAKNGGISNINVQCTYKPFTPYIKLYPTWGRLYGSHFSEGDFDARGLICGGDFSLPATTSAWETYELQNKNYQNTFDRQIQNLEVNNAVQREREAWGIAAGAVGSGVQGAVSGGLVGGPIGAAIGGIVSAGASLAAGIRDQQLNERLRTEAIDYTKDQFGYQLGNIKALPQSLSKVSAYNIDNKYFPFLEYYTCSDIEKQALRDKIKFNGMTIMVIGTMKQYVENYEGTDPMYFKAKIVRLKGLDGGAHILNALAGEIYKGVFIL